MITNSPERNHGRQAPLRPPTAVHPWFIPGLLDRNLVGDFLDALDSLGDVASPVFLIPRINEAAELEHAFKGDHVDVVVLVLSVGGQCFPDPGGNALVIDPFAGALGVAISGTAGQTARQRQRAEEEDQPTSSESVTRIE